MKNILNFIFKVACSILLLLLLEGIMTLGYAFDFAQYSWIGYLIQGCLVIICLKISSLDWDTKHS